MPRIRSVKPEFFGSESVGNCAPTTRLLFVALWCMADDDGRCVDNPKIIRAFAFPMDDDIMGADVDRMLSELHAARLIVRYEHEGRNYLAVRNFREHQHPQKPAPSKLPSPDDGTERESVPRPTPELSATTTVPLQERSSSTTLCSVGESRGVGEAQPAVEGAPRERVARPKPAGERKHPHFTEPYRSQVIDAWRRLGAVNVGRLVNAIGPCFRPPDDAAYVPPEFVVMAVGDYCGLVDKGKGAPFASPEDCAKRLTTLARNCQRLDAVDPVARVDANFLAIHGHRMPGAGVA